jgi:hypothetical protein
MIYLSLQYFIQGNSSVLKHQLNAFGLLFVWLSKQGQKNEKFGLHF